MKSQSENLDLCENHLFRFKSSLNEETRKENPRERKLRPACWRGREKENLFSWLIIFQKFSYSKSLNIMVPLHMFHFYFITPINPYLCGSSKA